MSTKFFRRTELVVNLAIIIAALLLATVLVKRYYFTTEDIAELRRVDHPIAVGTKVSLPDTDWARHRNSLLVIVSTKCHFCSESASFYRQLINELKGSDVGIIAVLPQAVNEGREYLNKLEVPINDVRQFPLDALGVNGTPTLIVVDKSGSVVDSWVGKLPPDKESDVLNELKSLMTDRSAARRTRSLID